VIRDCISDIALSVIYYMLCSKTKVAGVKTFVFVITLMLIGWFFRLIKGAYLT